METTFTEQPAYRRWFRLHRSTIILMLFVLAGFVVANTAEEGIEEDVQTFGAAAVSGVGWPCYAAKFLYYNSADERNLRWQVAGCCLNVALALGACLLAGTIWECLVRRKERHTAGL